ncbi:MAG TPA: hypothetical protein VK421_19005 [Pyrinomonadaceae bacterium]|nr:hypothetical protein [Pyrinomonadaceae bacterium]
MYAARLATAGPATAGVATPECRDLDARLSWLVAAEAEAGRRARLFRTPREECEMLMMPRPVSTERAFALFGLLLGALPPAAIFVRVFGNWPSREPGWSGLGLLALCLAMNAVCALVGRQMGRALGQPMIADAERRSWTRMILLTLVAALLWGVATGAAGGAVFFILGAIFGVICALAVALPAFLVFTAFHRLLARGGMIDERHLRPLAWGVSAVAAALILGL